MRNMPDFIDMPEMTTDNHIIEVNSIPGKEFGFTSDRFDGWLWRRGDDVYVSFIVSRQPRQGNLSRLFESIWDKGFTVKVPTPLGVMSEILARKGFTHTWESDPLMGEVSVWVKAPEDMPDA